MAQLWLNSIDEVYYGDEPYFFDSKEFHWVSEFQSNYLSIKNQVEYLVAPDSDRYNVYFQNDLQFPPSSWSTIGLISYGLEHHHNIKAFKELYGQLRNIPGIVTAYFSKMKPGSHIKPHCGPINATIRLHFGITIPSTDPENCGIKVGNQMKNWTEHGLIAFLDAHKHEAWNRTDKDRVVLIIDVIRPEFVGDSRWICCIMVFSYGLFKFLNWFNGDRITDYLRGKGITNVIQKIGAIAVYPFSFFFLKLSNPELWSQ